MNYIIKNKIVERICKNGYDKDEVLFYLKKFWELKNTLPIDKRDINQFVKKNNFNRLKIIVDEIIDDGFITSIDGYDLYKLSSYRKFMNIEKINSSECNWCIKMKTYFNDYSSYSDLYYLSKKDTQNGLYDKIIIQFIRHDSGKIAKICFFNKEGFYCDDIPEDISILLEKSKDLILLLREMDFIGTSRMQFDKLKKTKEYFKEQERKFKNESIFND